MDYDTFLDHATQRATERFRLQAWLHTDSVRLGGEIESLHLDDSLEGLTADEYMTTLANLAIEPGAELKREMASPFIEPTGIEFHGLPGDDHEVDPAFDYDFSLQGETQTAICASLDELIDQIEDIEAKTIRAAPEDSRFYRLGLTPSLILDDGSYDDGFTWERPDNGYDLDGYMNRKRRYRDIAAFYSDSSLVLGGAGSIQVTGFPRTIGSIDDTLSRFLGGGEKPGIPALAPLGWAPFMNSPIIEDDDLKTYYGREDAYWHRHALSPILTEDEGKAKYGYFPDFSDQGIDGVRDVIDIMAQKPFEFTAEIPASDIEAVDGPALHDRDDYFYLNEDTPLNVVAAHKENGDWQKITFQDFVEDQYLRGTVSLQTIDGDWHEEEVIVDYTDLDDDGFEDIAWENYLKAEGMNKPNYRPRMGIGAFESRDYCNSDRWKENIAMQAAWFRKWPEIQDIAYERLGLREDHAEDLREGVAQEGLDYELPNGMTVREGLAALQPVLVQGVVEVADDPGIVRDFNDMLTYTINGGEPPAQELYEAYQDDRLDQELDRYRVAPAAESAVIDHGY